MYAERSKIYNANANNIERKSKNEPQNIWTIQYLTLRIRYNKRNTHGKKRQRRFQGQTQPN
jgi:hypothetical protein